MTHARVAALTLTLALGACNASHVVGEVAGSALGACASFTPGPDLAVCSATYLPASDGRGLAVDLAADGVVVLGGRFPDDSFGVVPLAVAGGGAGALVRLAEGGRRVATVTRVGDAIVDLEIDRPSSAVALAVPPLGVVVLDERARALRWQKAVPAERVAAAGGFVAALGGDTVTVLAPDGSVRSTFAVAPGSDAAAVDVALDAASATIVVTGSMAQMGTFEVPLLTGYDYDGVVKWKAYGWTAEQARAAGNNVASTRGVRVSMGRDGKLYYLGQSIGGNTVHLLHPSDLGAAAPLVGIDVHSMTYAAGNARLAFVARLSPSTGRAERAHFLVARDPQDKDIADTIPSAVAADELGQVIVVGRQGCCAADTAQRAIAGVATAPSGADAFAAIFTRDFAARPVWATWGRGGASTGIAAAMGGGRAVMTAVQTAAERDAGLLVTHEAIGARPSGAGPDAFVSVFPVPP